jgi:hypothetical protein
MKEEWRKESRLCYRPVWHNNNHPWAKRPDLSHRLGWFKTCEHTNEAEDLGDIFYNNFEDVFNFIDLKVSNKVKFENYEKFLKTWVKRANRNLCMLHISNNNLDEDLLDCTYWKDIVEYLTKNVQNKWMLEIAHKRTELSYKPVDPGLLKMYRDCGNLIFMSIRQEVYDLKREVNKIPFQVTESIINFKDRVPKEFWGNF